MNQDHLPPWIGLGVAFRWVLSAIDIETAEAYERIHFHTSGRHKLTAPVQWALLEKMERGEAHASEAWTILGDALVSDAIQAEGIEADTGQPIRIRGLEWTRESDRSRADKDMIVRQDGRAITLVRLKTADVRTLISSMSGPVTAKAEKDALQFVADLLRREKDLSKSEVKAQLTAEGIPHTGRGFETRIWGPARGLAGLPAKAKAGAKPRNRRP